MDKKNWILFILLILMPIVYLVLNCIESSKYFLWGYSCPVNIIYLLNGLIFIGSLLILYPNIKGNQRSSFWTTLSLFFLVISIAHFIFIYSLSSFGF